MILFTSEIQLKKLEKADQIFMDSTFKIYPKNFYQLFNIIITIEGGKFIFPVKHILMVICFSNRISCIIISKIMSWIHNS